MLEDLALNRSATADLPIILDEDITSLAQLNLADELAKQYSRAQRVLRDVIDDSETAPNQKAQVLNTITVILKQIVDTQEALYSMERVKLMESCLVKVLRTLPVEAQKEFFTAYEQELRSA